MLVVVKKDEQELMDMLSSEVGFLAGLGSFDGEPFRLEGYQLAFLQNRSKYRWIVKARQTGYSLVFAAEAFARCHLRDAHSAIFVSYNLEDAKEKISYVRQLHDDLPLAFKKRLVVDSRTELVFESNGMSRRQGRIVSHPSKAPRGKKGDLYLDELAHYTNDREVYAGSTAVILRSEGQLSGCSSPLGRRGVFWEIATQELRSYPSYSRQSVPWWLCRFFCNDVNRAAHEAPLLETEERVERFGNDGIRDQFQSLALEDFRQEFEAIFCDETFSVFPYELILPCTSDDVTTYKTFEELPTPVEGRLTAGFDVGRYRDLSELVIIEELAGVRHLRHARSFDQVPFAEQEATLAHMLETLPIARLSIDQTGIGMHLAENLSRRFGATVRPETFTNANKEIWVNDFRILLQHKGIVLPKDRELVAQVHSINKRVTAAGNVVFDVDRAAAGRGHADRFWALALACQKERHVPTRAPQISVRVFG